MQIKVAYLPAAPLSVASDVCIVIDVIRATTAIIGLFDAGCERVFVSASRNDVAKARAAAGSTGAIFAEQDDGSSPDGYDHEPSPSLIARLDLAGRTAVLATANGTPAIVAANREGAALILVGSLRNLDAVARKAFDEAVCRGADITIICSGQLRNTRVAIEDAYCAGLMVEQLVQISGGTVAVDDSATLARGFSLSGASATDVLLGSMTGQRFAAQGRQQDVEFCADLNVSQRVPVIAGTGQSRAFAVHILDA